MILKSSSWILYICFLIAPSDIFRALGGKSADQQSHKPWNIQYHPPIFSSRISMFRPFLWPRKPRNPWRNSSHVLRVVVTEPAVPRTWRGLQLIYCQIRGVDTYISILYIIHIIYISLSLYIYMYIYTYSIHCIYRKNIFFDTWDMLETRYYTRAGSLNYQWVQLCGELFLQLLWLNMDNL